MVTKMSSLSKLLLLVFLSACTTMDQYFPNSTLTTVNGEDYLVRQLGPSTYQAVPNDPSKHSVFGTYDASVWANNIRAIEQVTGCKVPSGSVRNEMTNTVAAVDCKGV